MNVDGINDDDDEWETFWVHVYEFQTVKYLWNTEYATINSVWTRGKFSTGRKNLTKYDDMLHTGFTELTDWDSGESKATLTTYGYLVFADSTESDTLDWFPCHPDSGYRMDYSMHVTFQVGQGGGLSAEAPVRPTVLSFAAERLPSTGTADLRLGLRGSGRYTLDIYDISGRRVSRLLDATPLDAGIHRLTWDGQDTRGYRVAAGVYFARLQRVDATSPPTVRTARLVFLR